MFSSMVGANDGEKLTINGEKLEVYKYDLTDAKQRSTIEKYERDGIFGFTMYRFGAFLAKFDFGHKNQNAIIKTLRAF